MVAAKWLAVGLAVATTAAVAAGAPGDVGVAIAGYKPVTDVSEHARIDLDIRAMERAGSNWAAARRVYTQGANSNRSPGVKRTLQSFSTKYNKPGQLRSEPQALAAKRFWGDWDYADRHMKAVLAGADSAKYGRYRTGALAKTDAARKQMVKKLAKFTFVPQYVGHEAQLALTAYALRDYEEAAKHWDEAWAFYAGSLEKGTGNGFSAYILAEKRSKNFGTRAGGRSSVNRRMLAAFNAGKAALGRPGRGAAALRATKCVRALLLAPAIQGCLRYAYRVSDVKVTPQASLAKESAEAWAFCAAALPSLAAVDAAAARRVRAQTFLAGVPNPRISWPVVRAAFGASALNKMGLRCADVGSLNVEYPAAKHPVCRDGRVNNALAGTNFC